MGTARLSEMDSKTRTTALLLIAVMAVGSIVMWLVVPFAWIYGMSQLTTSQTPTMSSYVILLFGIPATMVVVGKLLGRVNRLYGERTGTHAEVKVVLPWHRSMRAERGSGHKATMLDVVMVCSVGIALVLFGLWFALFASPSAPMN